MKAILLIALCLSTLSSSVFANCKINISRVVEQEIGGLNKFKKILKQKGYLITKENVTKTVNANYMYADKIGGMKQLLILSLYADQLELFSMEKIVYETIGMKFFERQALIKFGKNLSICKE